MPKPGIKIVSDTPGTGPELKKGDRVRLKYDIQLNRGDFLAKDQETELTVGDRNFVAGLRYGLQGMRTGGTRKFRAGPNLCYRDQELASIPKNAVLIFDIKNVKILVACQFLIWWCHGCALCSRGRRQGNTAANCAAVAPT
jgi:FKBP-type peptidyl-prolyl cis-trans isomerase